MAKENMSDKTQPISKKIKLNFVYPDDLESKFSNLIIVQNQKDFFSLSFFETIIPLVLGETEEEKKEVFSKIEKADSKCLGRFVITPEKMEELIKILQENLEARKRMIEKEKGI